MKKRMKAADHVGLVYAIAKRYEGRGVELDELASIGTIGLMKAWGKFDSTRGLRFSTYAQWWISAEISRYFVTQYQGTVRRPIRGKGIKPKMLSMEVDYDGCTLHDLIPSHDETPEAAAIRTERVERVRAELERVKLSDRNRKIVQLRFLEGLSLDAVGKRVGLTRERVRQITEEALKKMKPHLLCLE